MPATLVVTFTGKMDEMRREGAKVPIDPTETRKEWRCVDEGKRGATCTDG